MSHILISYFNLSLFFSLEALLRIAPVVIWMKNIPCLAGNNVIILSPCVFLLLLFLLLLFFSYQRFMSQEIKDFALYTTVDTDPIVFLVDYQFTVVFSVFRLVGGLETLSALERVETDEKDRPKVLVEKRKKRINKV